MMRFLGLIISATVSGLTTPYHKLQGLEVHRAVAPFEKVEFTSLWEQRAVAVFLRSYG